MNERVQALADQARQSVPQGILDTNKWIETYNQLFAKLIIQETLEVARAGIEYGDGMETAVYRYFGVEE